MIIRYPPKIPAGKQVDAITTHIDLVPTLLELAEIEVEDNFDGKSMLPLALGEELTHGSEFYFTECTWMRKHGWRTPDWKLIRALEPDFHFKPPVELYNLVQDPQENHNVADSEPEIVTLLTGRMESWIAIRERETGNPAPVRNQPGWHGVPSVDYFTSAEQAYNALYVGGPERLFEHVFRKILEFDFRSAGIGGFMSHAYSSLVRRLSAYS
jgi:arylsulfatase A-like enzyme